MLRNQRAISARGNPEALSRSAQRMPSRGTFLWVTLTHHLGQADSWECGGGRPDCPSLTLAVRTFFPTESLRHLGREANRKEGGGRETFSCGRSQECKSRTAVPEEGRQMAKKL